MKKEQIPNLLTIGRILFIPIFIFIFDGFFACKERAFLGFMVADFSDAELLVRRSNDGFGSKTV